MHANGTKFVNQKQFINVLDCTIRDGSYAVDYQFTIRDVAVIGKALEKSGFSLIEIGHGVGLYGAEKGKGNMAETDEDYCKAAAGIFTRAKWGMFFIPGIGRKKDLDMAAGYGMKFCRIGFNIDQISEAETYIKYAKDLGMMVCANIMKSYAVAPEEFADYVYIAAQYGADVVYLVDSAGGMLPNEVRSYIQAARNKSSVSLGFHGHNNLSLGVANSIAAIEEGATYIDASLQGLGRSAGNTEAESLVMVLERLGYKTGVNGLSTLKIGERFVRPMISAGKSEIDIVCGAAQFHSSYLPAIYAAARHYDIDPSNLIIGVTKYDKFEADERLIDRVAMDLAGQHPKRKIFSNRPLEAISGSTSSPAGELAKMVHAQASKHGKKSAIALGFGSGIHKALIREECGIVVGSIEVLSLEDANEVLSDIEGRVDVILLDVNCSNESIAELIPYWERGLIPYDDHETLISSLTNFILQIRRPDTHSIVIVGNGIEAVKLAFKLRSLGFNITLWDEDNRAVEKIGMGLDTLLPGKVSVTPPPSLDAAVRRSDVVIGMGGVRSSLGVDILPAMHSDILLIDGLRGSLSSDLISEAKQQGVNLYRFDTRIGLAGIARAVLETRRLIMQDLGEHAMEGFNIVAGGVIGARGDVVTDSIAEPRSIVGVADGEGGLLASHEITEYEKRLDTVEQWILNKGLE